MSTIFNPGVSKSRFELAISQANASRNGTTTIIDPTGVPINKDIIFSNKYGPAVPFTSLLQSLQASGPGSGSGTGLCVLNTNLNSKISIFTDASNQQQLRFSPSVLSNHC